MDGTVRVAAATDLAAGERAEPGWQDCPGVLITLSKGDSGHRSNLQFVFSSIVYLLPMSFILGSLGVLPDMLFGTWGEMRQTT